MSFERFTGKRVVSDPLPSVALTAVGTLVFNKAALEQSIGAATHAELFFDAVTREVGISFVQSPQTPLPYKLTFHGRNGSSAPGGSASGRRRGVSAFISCREFYRVHGLPRRHLRRRLEWRAGDKLWAFKVPVQ